MKRIALLAVILVSCAEPGGKRTDATEQDRQLLQRHVEQRAAGKLAPGEVELIDIDRAGGFEARTPGLSAVRIVRDVYPARIVLNFKGSTRTLTGLPVAGAARYGDDPLRYERALLDDWLERELPRISGARLSDP
jgi:hypothetical protein